MNTVKVPKPSEEEGKKGEKRKVKQMVTKDG